MTLNPDQVGEAVWTGLVPEALVSGFGFGAMRFHLGANAGGARPAATAPDATLDLVVTIDPATNLVHQLQFRAWTKQDAGGGGAAGVFVVRAVAGVQIAGNGNGNGADDDDDEEDTKAAARKANAPMTYENGLPVRSRKKMLVMDYTVRLLEHGTRKAPDLDDEQKQLLGR